MTNSLRVAVLGGGSFGTAIANIIAANGHHTYLWMRDEDRAEKCQFERENPEYLPGYKLNDNLEITSDLVASVADADVVTLSVPSQSFREVARRVAPHIPENAIVLSTTKGIEGESFLLMSQILEQELGNVRIGVLSGPNFAKEIIQNQFTGSVIASEHDSVIQCIQQVFASKTFRIYANTDRYGVELGGALKNIYAIVTGMAAALGCGSNTQAMLLTRSLAEMTRLATALGANGMTFLGLAGVGDLILTCTSDLSRNYRVGYAIGKGESLAQVLDNIGQVAEGVNTVKIVKDKADEMGIYMPLVTGLHEVLFEGKDILEVVTGLMTGAMASDVDMQGGVQ
ncbi:NAD(P)H-dependent glycerol-3-phosphate dehydrogenase [Teredinibacter turnerae]|uniref:Glycerol-3-phosphate dehydrogenase [NAD(P)+] n=1 Tax=Teredinibacter turnerae (strain ATCC 39867 / T7901) TaxID=377629 RepID=GPDA_TERTT|nr:NAD(P)H-dependent glycerol-3-phosphate dehydrogenase [Teredinibacter turnerae]C5BL79.1 RecName: Full=Glycerol-3-phosphate dehydrogenase [NAD(P)+]; AltName: Full=NAD(P)H-dependent glycerol-3-phosphate dehydrogenase [Teredinibacter turnerae T7901]ACR12202.1 putative glycerol-3-phosphate dehydrogenase [Teredinibacter turnerae T7901]